MTETFASGRPLLDPGRMARLTLASPATRNAMSRAMWEALPAICDRVAADPAIRVLILAGDPPPRPALDARFASLFEGPDFREGTRALLAKRPPEF